ncbi:MAG: SLC13 family permease, partial [Xanthobacteraceae bacterium]
MPSQHFVPHIFFGLNPMMVSTVILCVTYGVIIWDKLNRAIVALLGASVMIFIGALDQDEAVKGIDWNTIGLLTGMMILVSISRRSGMFEYLAIWSAQKAKASPAGILVLLQITTAVVSALLDNVTTVLLVVPVTLAITNELDVPPYPFLFAQVFASNIGGTATLIGDPPNILIGSLVGLDFNAFLIHLAPVIVVIMAVQTLMIHLLWGRALKSTPARRALVMGMSAEGAIVDWTLLKQSLVVLTAVIAGFVLARPLHLEPATIA